MEAGPATSSINTCTQKAQAYPDILKNFIDVQPQLSNTMRITNLTDITIEAGTGKSKPSLDHTPIPVNL